MPAKRTTTRKGAAANTAGHEEKNESGREQKTVEDNVQNPGEEENNENEQQENPQQEMDEANANRPRGRSNHQEDAQDEDEQNPQRNSERNSNETNRQRGRRSIQNEDSSSSEEDDDDKENKKHREAYIKPVSLDSLQKKVIILDKDNFSAWKDSIEEIAYYREWPEHILNVEGEAKSTWDGKEERSRRRNRQRREAYFILKESPPAGSHFNHLINSVRRGDPNMIYRIVHDVLLKKDAETAGEFTKTFFNLSMANTRLTAPKFGAKVIEKSKLLSALGKHVSDDEKKTVFLDGLAKEFHTIVTTLNTDKTCTFSKAFSSVYQYGKKHNLLETKDRSNRDYHMFNSDLERNKGQFKKKPKYKGNYKKKKIRCYACGEEGHFARDCKNSENNSKSKPTRKVSFLNQLQEEETKHDYSSSESEETEHFNLYNSMTFEQNAALMIREIISEEKEDLLETSEEEGELTSEEKQRRRKIQQKCDSLSTVGTPALYCRCAHCESYLKWSPENKEWLSECESCKKNTNLSTNMAGPQCLYCNTCITLNELIIVGIENHICRVCNIRPPPNVAMINQEQEEDYHDMPELHDDSSSESDDANVENHYDDDSMPELASDSDSSDSEYEQENKNNHEYECEELVNNLEGINNHGKGLVMKEKDTKCNKQEPKHLVEEWMLDSGSSFHMTPFYEDVCGAPCEECDVNVQVGNSEYVNMTKRYTIQRENEKGKTITLNNVYLNKELPIRILSEGNIVEGGNSIIKKDKEVSIKNANDEVILHGNKKRNKLNSVLLWKKNNPNNRDLCAASAECFTNTQESIRDVHERYGHTNMTRCRQWMGLPPAKNILDDYQCEACCRAEIIKTKVPKQSTTTRARNPIYRLHIDASGTRRASFMKGKRLTMFIVDDESRFTWVQHMEDRTQMREEIKILKTIVLLGTMCSVQLCANRAKYNRRGPFPSCTYFV